MMWLEMTRIEATLHSRSRLRLAVRGAVQGVPKD